MPVGRVIGQVTADTGVVAGEVILEGPIFGILAAGCAGEGIRPNVEL
jgi:hypothetical protein